jgi:hypothetical protein
MVEGSRDGPLSASNSKEAIMAAKKKTEDAPVHDYSKPVNLTAAFSTKAVFPQFNVWIVGRTPLITHAWSEKARREMLGKQLKATKGGREIRDPQAEFVSSLYELGDGTYGFPATGIKKSFLSAAHKDKGIPKVAVLSSLWIDAPMVRCRPALAGAVCDMPLIRIYSGSPEMREDMVKIGSGLNKIANMSYRGQFRFWAMNIKGRFNASVLTPNAIAALIQEAGVADGFGEWRNSKSGVFGEYGLATEDEERAWNAFAAGTGPLPVPEDYRDDEAAE